MATPGQLRAGQSKVVALVAAFQSAETVGQTVSALRDMPGVDQVLVVDDGSRDTTSQVAAGAGARVLRLPRNVGKGGAVRAGLDASADADVYLLVDADVGATAALVEGLLSPVVEGTADMTIAALPAAGRQGGLGVVKNLAAAGIRRATGYEPRAPLSGQRGVRGDLLRSLALADRFGLETALTIDARRAGARVLELDLPMTHHHRGRSVAGFRHRAGQGVDIVRALWPRLTTRAQRISLMVACLVLLAGTALLAGSRSQPASVPLAERPSKVVVFSAPRLQMSDLGTGAMPNLDRLAGRGAVAATSVTDDPPRWPPERADLVLVDVGERDPAGADRLLGEVVSGAGPGALLLVASLPPPADARRLTPMVIQGPGIPAGYLYSPSTGRQGLVASTDVMPTILSWLGDPVPDDTVGRPLRFDPGPPDLAHLRRMERDAAFRDDHYVGIVAGFAALQALIYLLAAMVFTRSRVAGRAGALLRWLVLSVSAYPLAALLLRLVPRVAELGTWAIVVLVALDLVVVALTVQARRHPLSPLAWICGATVMVLVADVATGAHMQFSGFLGYSPYEGTRFTGFANSAFAALAAATILAAALHLHHASRRDEAVLAVALLFALVLLADGAPSLGADFGGVVTLAPVLALVAWRLAGRRLSLRAALLAGGASVAAVIAAVTIDLLRPPKSRTHVGRLGSRILDEGWRPLGSALDRKVDGALQTFGPPWVWVLAVLVAGGLFFLGRRGGWANALSRLLPSGSPLRAGAAGALAVGLVGAFLNDSGVVVTALVVVFLGPFLTLLALDRQDGPLTVVDPEPAEPAATPMTLPLL